MEEISSIERFKDQRTWRLFGLGIITYGVYFAYYIKRQTAIINEMVDVQERISDGFVNTILVMSYISLILLFPYVAVDDGHPVEMISNLIDSILGVMLLVWGFKARNRLNAVYDISKYDKEWFHGLWTFLFSPMYFNYKINSICKESVEQVAPADS